MGIDASVRYLNNPSATNIIEAAASVMRSIF